MKNQSNNQAEQKTLTPDPSSFRDNRGQVVWQNKTLLRTIHRSAKPAYDKLMQSGLYEQLKEARLIVEHTEVSAQPGTYKTIQPKQIPFISYPYEWSFSQLRDAALTTLEIQKQALQHGMSLRDASAYNIQFLQGKPVFIDTLSFDVYKPGEPWQAYRQFCQHFLAPLALASYRDVDLIRLSALHIDGIPLSLASKLLPQRHKVGSLGVHIAMHARLSQEHADSAKSKAKAKSSHVSLEGSRGILDSLDRAIQKLKLHTTTSTWSTYYDHTNYSASAFKQKEDIIETLSAKLQPGVVLDLGANNGHFSRLASQKADLVVSCDIDPLAVEANYLRSRQKSETKLLPLTIDLTNPSPAIGWGNTERPSFYDRVNADLVLALALVHHLAIGGNVPLPMIAEQFSKLGRELIVEFIPKTDSQVSRLLASREDIFDSYSKAGFEEAFSKYYELIKSYPLKSSQRIIYHYKVRAV